MLQQIDTVRLQSLERLVDLFRRGVLRAAVDLCHQEDLLAIPIAERLAHADLAAAVVVVPGVVHEGDAAVDRASDEADRCLIIFRLADVIPAETDH